ncbi:MAG: hypothetical protein RBJ76_01930 [Stenomitos frigidus ULC029]
MIARNQAVQHGYLSAFFVRDSVDLADGFLLADDRTRFCGNLAQ